MLVLSRKQGEQLKIGDDITVTVLEVRGGRLTLGIEAPRGMRILRGELDSFRESAPPVAKHKTSLMQLSA